MEVVFRVCTRNIATKSVGKASEASWIVYET